MSEGAAVVFAAIADMNGPFTNADLVRATGIKRQVINHHLNQFERKGIIKRDNANPKYRVLVASGTTKFVEENLTSISRPARRHAKVVIKDFKKFQDTVEFVTLARNLGLPIQRMQDYLQDKLREQIAELRNELVYLNTKQTSPERAIQLIQKFNLDDFGAAIDEDFRKQLREMTPKELNVSKALDKVINGDTSQEKSNNAKSNVQVIELWKKKYTPKTLDGEETQWLPITSPPEGKEYVIEALTTKGQNTLICPYDGTDLETMNLGARCKTCDAYGHDDERPYAQYSYGHFRPRPWLKPEE